MHSLMAIYAHPDDESYSVGGVLAKYASQGIPTYVVCATRGEVGEIADPSFATPATLGQVRESELREACRILGVKEVVFLDYIDGQLDKADPNEAQERMPFPVRAIQSQRDHGVDGGSEFQAAFEQACQSRLAGYEVVDFPLEITALNQQLLAWEHIYNTIRPHQALGYLTPLQFIAQWHLQKQEVKCQQSSGLLQPLDSPRDCW